MTTYLMIISQKLSIDSKTKKVSVSTSVLSLHFGEKRPKHRRKLSILILNFVLKYKKIFI